MDIKVSEIQPEGMTVEMTERPEDIGDLGLDIMPAGPAWGRFKAVRTGTTVYLSGEVTAKVELVCSRCGKTYVFDAGSRFELDINPFESMAAEEENELQSGELEVEFYKDDTIDLSGLMREQVLLQVPMKPLCREECLGLCQYCGKDLNEGQCGCEPPTGHPGLSGLKDLLKDK